MKREEMIEAMARAMFHAECERSRQSAKAAGHRDWAAGVCFDHAGTSWEEFMATLPAAERAEVERLADGLEAAASWLLLPQAGTIS